MRFLPVILLSLTTLLSHAEERVLTPKDVANLRYVSTAKISPDGNSVAYSVTVPRKLFKEENGGAWRELHVWDETRGGRPFISGQVNVSEVDWTPDGKGISYLAKRKGDETSCLYVIPLAGGEAALAA